jgi:hypothetical protein
MIKVTKMIKELINKNQHGEISRLMLSDDEKQKNENKSIFYLDKAVQGIITDPDLWKVLRQLVEEEKKSRLKD